MSFQADIEEMVVETQLAEDRAKKTMIDTARLAGMPFRKRPFLLPWNIDRKWLKLLTLLLSVALTDAVKATDTN